MQSPDPKAVASKVIELMGGREAAFEAFDEEFDRLNRTWAQDTSGIGRVLRSHLFVEHFLSEYLKTRAPELDIVGAQLTFAKKLSLLGEGASSVRHLIPGMKRLNAVRNRMGHTLKADVTEQDLEIILSIGLFRAMREEAAKGSGKPVSNDPIATIEEFALHVGAILQSAACGHADVWTRAYELVAIEENADDDNSAT